MANERIAWDTCAVVAAGVAWPFVCRELFHLGGYVLLPQVQLVQSLGATSSQEITAFIHISDPIIWALLIGVLFGVPLAAIVRRSILQYWLLFVATVIATQLVWAAQTEFGAAGIIPTLLFPPFWGYLFGVLVFWWVAASVFSRRAKVEPAP